MQSRYPGNNLSHSHAIPSKQTKIRSSENLFGIKKMPKFRKEILETLPNLGGLKLKKLEYF